jgi:predicted KAP-like P-loop ATPase
MTNMSETFNDSPITLPSQDQFGIDHFAQAIGRSLRDMVSPSGVTIAVNGPWGSGKSSAINLIRHHLASSNDPNLVVVDFTCWWIRGEEALTIAFLQALDGALEKGIGKEIRTLIPRIGKKLLQAGSVVGAAASAISAPAGTFVSSTIDFASRFFSDSESIETGFNELSTALR